MSRPRTVNRFPSPEREVSGIILPEFVLYAMLQDLPVNLKKGKYGDGSLEEPIFAENVGISKTLIDDCFASLMRDQVRLSLMFPKDAARLPMITVAAESMDPTGFMIGDDGGNIDEENTWADADEVLTPDGGAVGGETEFFLRKRPVIGSTLKLERERSGEAEPLYTVGGEFTIDASSGRITLGEALQAGDVLTATEYAYRTIPGGQYFTTVFSFSHVIFVDTINPLITAFLSALVWRELMVNQSSLLDAGFRDLQISRRSLSMWDQWQPAVGIRAEIVVNGIAEWTAYKRVDPIRYWTIDIDQTDGEESITTMSGEIDSFGESVFVNETE